MREPAHLGFDGRTGAQELGGIELLRQAILELLPQLLLSPRIYDRPKGSVSVLDASCAPEVWLHCHRAIS
jgi:hypothetical protein